MATGNVPLPRFLEDRLQDAQSALHNLSSGMEPGDYKTYLSGVRASAYALEGWRQKMEERLRMEVKGKGWDEITDERMRKLHSMVKGKIRLSIKELWSSVNMMLDGRKGLSGAQLVSASFQKLRRDIDTATAAVETEMETICESIEETLESMRNALKDQRKLGRESESSTARRAEVRLMLPRSQHDESA